MTLEGFKPGGSRDVRDRSVGPRDLLRLPIVSVTRDAEERIETVVQQATGPDGVEHTLTSTVAYDVATGLVSSITQTFEGSGKTFTETETFSRDAEGNVTGSSIAIS